MDKDEELRRSLACIETNEFSANVEAMALYLFWKTVATEPTDNQSEAE
jgi:hypothetical protein